MKICTWNCRYGLTLEKAAYLCQAGYNADIYAIQEYDMRNNKPIHEIEKHLGQLQDKYGDGREYRDNAESGGDLGLALFSNTYRIERIYSNTIPYRYVVPYKVTCKETNESFMLIHVWTKIADLKANQKQDYIMQVIGALENPTYNKLLIPEDNKALWIGDFNSSMQLKNEIDKNNHTRFLETMKKYGLVSAYHTNRQKKTWKGRSVYFYRHI
ncbi:endonuclease/exonuclease/phosphatase family protein [Treponema vincentii]|uniref:endonuclease/exonuclease/phosphatase family protein n=1 Tax=Treponema vincentii TaxID=69710 RepID=UPI003D945259